VLLWPPDSLPAAATTLVTMGGGFVTAQETTSEMSSGFVGSRMSPLASSAAGRKSLPEKVRADEIGVAAAVVVDDAVVVASAAGFECWLWGSATDGLAGASSWFSKAAFALTGSAGKPSNFLFLLCTDFKTSVWHLKIIED
jgi:hypothetical protein